MHDKNEIIQPNQEKYNFTDTTKPSFTTGTGLTEDIIRTISARKNEPRWMLNHRIQAFALYRSMPIPSWLDEKTLSELHEDRIQYYVDPTEQKSTTWEEVPEQIKNTFDKLGVPEAERKFLAGVTAQYESEVVYHKLREDLERQGIIFMSMDDAVRQHPDLVQEYFGTIVPAHDNRYAALNTAAWSGGSFVYIPPGINVEIPLQAYFRINTQNMGQFERSLIIADEGSSVHYIEGCTAPTYTTESLHAAVVEIIAKKNATLRYTTIQNWSKNVFNLVTKRSKAYENALIEWVDGNLGARYTVKYPTIILAGEGARGTCLSIAFAGKGQYQDAGAKMIHAASHTSSTVTSKSISKDGGRSLYRGLIHVAENAAHVRSNVRCDALIMDDRSHSDTIPRMVIKAPTAKIEHEATVSKVDTDQLFYLMARGLTQQQAINIIVNGFIEAFVKELPLEYAVELNRLIRLEMEGGVG